MALNCFLLQELVPDVVGGWLEVEKLVQVSVGRKWEKAERHNDDDNDDDDVHLHFHSRIKKKTLFGSISGLASVSKV